MIGSKFTPLFVVLSCAAFTGCSTVSDFKPVTKNGQEYIMNYPVLATGTVEEVHVIEKNGTVHTIAQSGADLAGDGAIGASLATNAGGLSNFQGGAIAGALGAVFSIIAESNAPKVEVMIRNDADGELKSLHATPQMLKNFYEYRCIDIGDKVRVIKNPRGPGLDLYNANSTLLRLSDFQPTCEELKAKAAADSTAEASEVETS